MKKSELMKLIENARTAGIATVEVKRSEDSNYISHYKMEYNKEDKTFVLSETDSGIVFDATTAPEIEYDFVTYG